MRKYWFSVLFFFVVPEITIGQEINGYVYDCDSSESLIGAYVNSSSGDITITNNQGYFYFSRSNISDSLMITYAGYKSKTIPISKEMTVCLNIGVELEGVTIYGKNTTEILKEKLNSVTIPISKIKELPTLFGEPDVLKAFAIKPGISTGYEGASGLFIRGGSPDQNLILLDDNPIYNSGHLLGFVSFINPNAVKAIRLDKAYFKPKYGGRLSSVVDIQMKDGNKSEGESELSLGLISSSLKLERPVIKDKTSLAINGRSSYLNLFTLPVKHQYKNGKKDKYENYWLYDVNAKLHHKFNDLQQVYVSFFNGEDNYKQLNRTSSGEENVSRNQWGSTTLSTRYTQIINNNIVWNSSVGINNYKSKVIGQTVLSDLGTYSSTYTTGVKGVNSSSMVDIDFSNVKLNTGVEYNLQNLNPGILTDSSNVSTSLFSDFSKINSFAAFGELSKSWSNWSLDLGVRFNHIKAEDWSENLIEPRLQIIRSITDDAIIRASYVKMHQSIFLLANNGLSFPTDYWLPANRDIGPAFSDMISLGTSFNIRGIESNFDIYYKKISRTNELRPGVDYFDYTSPIEDKLVQDVSGRAYGIEIGLVKNWKNTSLEIGYTLSKNERKSNELNEGQWYPYAYDRRHDISVVVSKDLGRNWKFTSIFNYLSGRSFTLPSSFYLSEKENDIVIVQSFDEINNARFPSNHRLDISFFKKYSSSSLTFGLYNVYGRINPINMSFIFGQEFDGHGFSDSYRSSATKEGLRGPIPFINYTIEF